MQSGRFELAEAVPELKSQLFGAIQGPMAAFWGIALRFFVISSGFGGILRKTMDIRVFHGFHGFSWISMDFAYFEHIFPDSPSGSQN